MSQSRMSRPENARTIKDYIVQAWHEIANPSTEQYPPTSIFAREIAQDEQPVINSDQANHILTYIGAFNPPHSGHIQILADGFYNSGPGLNIVSTLVLPIPDDGIKSKEAARVIGEPAPRQVTLSVEDRAELIAAHLRDTEELWELACKTTVLAFPVYQLIPACMRLVEQLAAADGFHVEFVSLKGPDHLFYDRPIKHPALEICTKIIISKGTRLNEDMWVEGGLRQLVGGWSSWYAITWQTSDGVTRTAWEATRSTAAGSAVRLLPNDDPAAIPEISSTRIRKVILESDPRLGENVLVKKLRESYAICPERLAGILVAYAQ